MIAFLIGLTVGLPLGAAILVCWGWPSEKAGPPCA
jgi:hypothetical protein